MGKTRTRTADTPAAPVVGNGAETKAIVPAAAQDVLRGGFDTPSAFEHLQRASKPWNTSSLVPEHYRGDANFGNCMIAVEMAARVRASPMMVMQNLYIVHGKPGWSSQFLIATFNASGRFGPIDYEEIGKPGTDSYGIRATTYNVKTGNVLKGPPVTMEMAKKEGWFSKPGSKWQTIPELMLRYRAATFLVRVTAPEIGMGMQTVDEIEDTTLPGQKAEVIQSPPRKFEAERPRLVTPVPSEPEATDADYVEGEEDEVFK